MHAKNRRQNCPAQTPVLCKNPLTFRKNAPAHQRTSAPAHQRTSAPAHQRTSAPAHQRTFARSALAAALIAAGVLSSSPDVFAVEVSTDQQYRDALYGNDTTITVKQDVTITPRQFFRTWANPGEIPRPVFTLEGQVDSDGNTSVIRSNSSALGTALHTGSDGVYPSPVVNTIRNLTFDGFSATWGEYQDDPILSVASVLNIGKLQNGLHNLCLQQ